MNRCLTGGHLGWLILAVAEVTADSAEATGFTCHLTHGYKCCTWRFGKGDFRVSNFVFDKTVYSFI